MANPRVLVVAIFCLRKLPFIEHLAARRQKKNRPPFAGRAAEAAGVPWCAYGDRPAKDRAGAPRLVRATVVMGAPRCWNKWPRRHEARRGKGQPDNAANRLGGNLVEADPVAVHRDRLVVGLVDADDA